MATIFSSGYSQKPPAETVDKVWIQILFPQILLITSMALMFYAKFEDKRRGYESTVHDLTRQKEELKVSLAVDIPTMRARLNKTVECNQYLQLMRAFHLVEEELRREHFHISYFIDPDRLVRIKDAGDVQNAKFRTLCAQSRQTLSQPAQRQELQNKFYRTILQKSKILAQQDLQRFEEWQDLLPVEVKWHENIPNFDKFSTETSSGFISPRNRALIHNLIIKAVHKMQQDVFKIQLKALEVISLAALIHDNVFATDDEFRDAVADFHRVARGKNNPYRQTLKKKVARILKKKLAQQNYYFMVEVWRAYLQ